MSYKPRQDRKVATVVIALCAENWLMRSFFVYAMHCLYHLVHPYTAAISTLPTLQMHDKARQIWYNEPPLYLGALMTDPKFAQKMAAAATAKSFIIPNAVIGIGTGSTVNCLIDLLEPKDLAGAVSSSKATQARLIARGIAVLDPNEAGALDLYIDGADEIDGAGNMIKGGGAALTQEKIVAQTASRFICIVDEGKCVDILGAFGLPIEVIASARAHIARRCVALGGVPEYRTGVVTDNGHQILDVYGLKIDNPQALESQINQWAGVVCNGIFAQNRADVTIIGSADGVRIVEH